MEFIERQVQYPGKKKLVKVDANNVPIPNEPEIWVNIERDEGNVTVVGTPINAANLNAMCTFVDAGNLSGSNVTSWIAKLLTGAVNFGDKINSKTTATNGYITFTSGLRIMWGIQNIESVGANTTTTINLPATMPDTNYIVVITSLGSSGQSDGNNHINAEFDGFTTTNFKARKVGTYAKRAMFIAIRLG